MLEDSFVYSEYLLRKRLEYFLTTNKLNRNEIKEFIEFIRKESNVVIFGGMLRDLSLSDNKLFRSDIDLVVDSINQRELYKLIKKYNPIMNKFGGFRILLNKWKLDIWSLSNTWAINEGLVIGDNFTDLLKTSFFTWDAIIYEIPTKKFKYYDNYFKDLNSGFIDINLRSNPNPIGITIRTLRMLFMNKCKISFELLNYIIPYLKKMRPEDIVSFENKSFEKKILNKEKIELINKYIHEHVHSYIYEPFGLPELEPRLPWNFQSIKNANIA
ncbi:hypothetical protein [Leptospira sp. GIMC2001]|uniref:hypothetical protein n=1 Tax=Leptospira sp. GIMC2001 TaxID=1513297 RepID=UPI00234AB34B|nr:hypothetical protein [Leptospira sp. GIMC2001]WCL51026.1 hypothetical protein O4O04_09500 [Leptospira sp. GIMC2001]